MSKKKSLFESLCRKKESGGTILVEQITLGTVPDERERNTAESLRMQESYEELFLNRNETVHRKQTYISCETYSLLARILPMVKEGMTVPAFLDNVLAQPPLHGRFDAGHTGCNRHDGASDMAMPCNLQYPASPPASVP